MVAADCQEALRVILHLVQDHPQPGARGAAACPWRYPLEGAYLQ